MNRQRAVVRLGVPLPLIAGQVTSGEFMRQYAEMVPRIAWNPQRQRLTPDAFGVDEDMHCRDVAPRWRL